ncbi:hypothetical protein N7486_004366 [Penicillium sp. IBT 16267x]|nr:hypothetical protein N7486_004366 [Penicillium sp. IBT 16267x]
MDIALEPLPSSRGSQKDTDSIFQLTDDDGWVNISSLRRSKSMSALDDPNDLIVPIFIPSSPIPVPMPKGGWSKGRREIGAASREMLIEAIENHTIGFELDRLCENIRPWTSPDLKRDTPLPGSYGQLLVLMFGAETDYIKLQTLMANRCEEWDYVQTHREEIIRVDKTRNFKLPWNMLPRESATLRADLRTTPTSRRMDEMFFEFELRVLRDLVAPLRGDSHNIFWVSSRQENSKEMLDEWEWSMELIEEFRNRIVRTEWRREDNWTIYDPAPVASQRREINMTLHQCRIDACKGTMIWNEYLPNKLMYEDMARDVQEYCSTGTCTPKLTEINGYEPPPYIRIPPVQISNQGGYDLKDDIAFDSENGWLLNLLVQVAEWLALARGFPAVHLFTDICRLFTVYGVDVANATQVRFCKFMAHMSLPDDSNYPTRDRIHSLFPDQVSIHPYFYLDARYHNGIMRYSANDQFNSLLARDNNSISWTFPLQILEWGSRGERRRYLELKTPFPRRRHGPTDFVDKDEDDQLLEELQAEDLSYEQTSKSAESPKPPCSKKYPLFDDDELAILLGWQDLNGYNEKIRNKIAREAYSREGEVDLLFDGTFEQVTRSV